MSAKFSYGLTSVATWGSLRYVSNLPSTYAVYLNTVPQKSLFVLLTMVNTYCEGLL